MKIKKLKNGTVCSPLGFKASGIHCGIRSSGLDLALIYSIVGAQAVGMFTRNTLAAAPVKVCRTHLRAGTAQAIIANSGNANCCTGRRGELVVRQTVDSVAQALSISPRMVLPASTGIIGKQLPVEKIVAAIPQLVGQLNFDQAEAAARAIMTTDRYPKQAAVEILIGGKKVRIGAMAKGAGMICPNMATMLCFITTDVHCPVPVLRQALAFAVEQSFNRVSVDGDMSTNDTVVLLANGLADNVELSGQGDDFQRFVQALTEVCRRLALLMVEDGEGASKIIEVIVEQAKNEAEARTVARRIADSPLVKTMMAGENPNWGRVAAAVGASGVRFSVPELEIRIQNKPVFRGGEPLLKDIRVLRPGLARKKIQVTVRLHGGNASYTMWASDLTAEYVRINTEYN